MYAEIVFPLPFRNSFTYIIPEEFEQLARTGVRAVAPFGKRVLTGFIIEVSLTTDKEEKLKSVSDILDSEPIFTEKSLEFYKWLSDYYLSSLGEALKLAVPYGLDIESKKRIVVDPEFCKKLLNKETNKTSTRKKVLGILCERETITFTNLQKLANKKSIYSVVKTLEKQGAVTILDEVPGAKVNIKKRKYVKAVKSLAELYEFIPSIESRSPKQVKIIIELITSKKKSYPLKNLLEKTGSSQSSVDSLAEKGIVEVFDKEIERKYHEVYEEALDNFRLTEDQDKVIEEAKTFIEKNEFAAFLLHGVTGSGKTQIYIELVKQVLDKDKTALILVPEISLTPQITSRLINNFGDSVTVIHSRMSHGERYDSWRHVLKGKTKVVIGARSALFAPLKNIGLIVIDEEHDASYKQSDQVPKYNARDSAIKLASLYKCPVLLGSATPSAESMHNALTGKYRLLELRERIDNAKLPKIVLVNVIVEKKKKKMENVFSKLLLDKIEDRLRKKEGVIILQNRRGFSTQIYCEDCLEVETCDNCSVPMVYHINQNTIQCHYCGTIKKVPNACTNCGSIHVKYFGAGTERVEDEIEFFFPTAVVKRIDSDSISRKSSLSKILMGFSKGEVDILVGTQMVSKGLDFSHVTLVGVISAETSLWLPDFRADERTFQLLTQVSGRAGRKAANGEVIIQTQNENNFTLKKVVENDYKGFFERMILDRQKMGYPPFTRICLVESKDPDEEKARGAIEDFYKELSAYKKWLAIHPPSTALISRLKGNYRFHILIKSSKDTDAGGKILRQAVLNSWIEFNRKSRFKDVRLFYDVDPQSLM